MTNDLLEVVATAIDLEVYRQYRAGGLGRMPRKVVECLDYQNLASVALHAADTRRGWRPIETAPRDGTRFLFWNGLAVGVGRYLGQSGSIFGADSFAGETGLDPTHWMPLPEAPR